MTILFYCNWNNKDEWLKKIKKKFKNEKIFTLKDKPDFSKIKISIIWNLPDEVYQKLNNLKLLFSLGAGVDHILHLPSYNQVPIIRLKDEFMAERMSNHVLSQILQYQLNLKNHMKNQLNRKWMGEDSKTFQETSLNSNLTIGILGCGYLGTYLGKTLKKLGYNVIGFKNSKPAKKFQFQIFYQKKYLKKFIKNSDIIVVLLPSTFKTFNFINNIFLNVMKKQSLLINVGRGSTINEKDLINHLKKNKFFYASLDVFKNEPLSKKHPFWYLPNVTITPHIASLTVVVSAVSYIYKKYQEFKKSNKFKSDVNLKKGY